MSTSFPKLGMGPCPETGRSSLQKSFGGVFGPEKRSSTLLPRRRTTGVAGDLARSVPPRKGARRANGRRVIGPRRQSRGIGEGSGDLPASATRPGGHQRRITGRGKTPRIGAVAAFHEASAEPVSAISDTSRFAKNESGAARIRGRDRGVRGSVVGRCDFRYRIKGKNHAPRTSVGPPKRT